MRKGRKTKNIEVKALLSKRILSYGIDLIIECILFFTFLIGANSLYMQSNTKSQGDFVLLCCIITFCFLFIYLPAKHNGQTFGKLFLQIKTVSNNQHKISFFQNFAREFIFKFMFCLFLIPASFLQILYHLIRYRNLDRIIFFHDAILFTHVIACEKRIKKGDTK